MSYQHIIRNGSEVPTTFARQRAGNGANDYTEGFRPKGPCEPPLGELNPEAEPRTAKADRLDLEMVALWIFVFVSFAALFLAGSLIWAKCNGGSPDWLPK